MILLLIGGLLVIGTYIMVSSFGLAWIIFKMTRPNSVVRTAFVVIVSAALSSASLLMLMKLTSQSQEQLYLPMIAILFVFSTVSAGLGVFVAKSYERSK
ncbi:hypothetical protein [Parasphingorhabdus sp.]|uniref:hypothetical protein n=1 Tax=Parasphingorhabdus sp. TaxID=2709688 RepID=UPI003BB0ACB4